MLGAHNKALHQRLKGWKVLAPRAVPYIELLSINFTFKLKLKKLLLLRKHIKIPSI
jgi:hypothetical protein